MPKRKRTRLRFDEFFNLAITSGQQEWPKRRTDQELEVLIEKNYDLADRKAQETARDEFYAMADPGLVGWLPQLRDIAERIMERELAGTKKRFNHEMIGLCRRAIKHPHGAAGIIQESLIDLEH